MGIIISLAGDINFNTVPTVWQDVSEKFNKSSDVQLDFTNVTNCNSAALALLVECIRESLANNIKLKIINMPEKLLEISLVCGMDKFIKTLL